MSKIYYEIFESIGELAGYERCGGDITFSFTGSDSGHLSIAGHSYEIIGGSVSVPARNIPDGTYIPRLILKREQILLPTLAISGNNITFPEKENAIHSLSLRLSRQSARLGELENKLEELEEYVRGSTCF